MNEAGETFVVGAGDKYELFAKNELPGLYWSTPTIAHDSLLLRSADKLHCIRKR